MGRGRQPIPSLSTRQTAWIRVAISAVIVTFTAAMVGCAVHDWHAPSMPVLAVIWIIGILFGNGAALLRRKSMTSEAPVDADEIASGALVRVRNAARFRLVVASLVACVTSAIGAVVVATTIADWRTLVLASFVGSLWMATYPLHVVVADAILEKRITVGLDGVRIGSRHVPYRAMKKVSAEDDVLEIQGRDGRIFRNRCPSVATARALADGIHAQIASTESAANARTAREGRRLDEWKRALLASDYRAPEMSSDEAARIMRSGGARPDERIGAALVLAGRGGDDVVVRERIRVAASDCVDPKLRVALERVADDRLDDETLAEIDAIERVRTK